MPRWLRFIFSASLILVALLLIIAAAGGASSAVFERYFPALLVTNVFAAITLFAFVVAIILRLFKRWREHTFGSRMTGRLAITTTLIAVSPCLLIYLVSSQFIGRSIDSWFDVRVEHALGSGVTLSSEIISREQSKLKSVSQRLAVILSQTPTAERTVLLDRAREASDVSSVILFDPKGTIIDGSFSRNGNKLLETPAPKLLENALKSGGICELEGDALETNEELRIRAVVPVVGADKSIIGYLQLLQLVPAEIASNASDLVNGYRNYQELALSRNALRTIYTVTLTLTMLLSVLGAVAAALSFARKMTAPVLQLAVGTKKVAEGDLRPIREFAGSDEINALTQSFNSMISQIAEARRSVENQRAQAERARAYLERILGTLSSGVLVVDDDLNIVMANASASTILKPSILSPGLPLGTIEPELSAAISDQIHICDDDLHLETELSRRTDEQTITLFIRGSRIALDKSSGWVIVFDDISPIIDAQRAVAWGEVARRLAHEIKNPLTPIRLAAERLEMKLGNKLDGKDAQLLSRTCGTIVNQVDAMKQMVNDFRDYAKLPSARLEPIDINALMSELESLYKTAGTPVHTLLARNLPKIYGDQTQLRQVIHNLVGNAVDATMGKPAPAIDLTTSPVVRSGRRITAVRITIEDNGNGFPPHILTRAFEPYITTKATGTGLGLPMVKKIIDEHHAKISISNKTNASGDVLGAEITIVFPVIHDAQFESSKPL